MSRKVRVIGFNVIRISMSGKVGVIISKRLGYVGVEKLGL